MTGRRRKTTQPDDDPSSWAHAELQAFVERRIKQLEAEGVLDVFDDDEPEWLRNL
jgi:CelD/BcsL family acetyltransferase involved in cellulose biosynthesis